jgi:alpha-galactosidase
MKPRRSLVTLLFLSAVILLTACGETQKKQEAQEAQPAIVSDNLALTPPMGWNSWNGLGKNVSEDLIKSIADSFITLGLKDAGYTYINLDDYWQGKRDSVTGLLSADPVRFPSGIKALSDYVHSRGLKLGIYSDAGTMTCGDQPGSYGYEENDAKTFAEWGVDYLKYDYCYCNDYASQNNDYKEAIKRYKAMGDALKATGRPMVFSICEWGPRSPWLWGKEVGGHLWRTSYDVGDKWEDPRNEHSQIGILTSIDVMCDLERFAGPGGWNDPDMLVIGLGNSGYIKGGGCTEAEYRTQMSMWCMFSAPLIISCDVRNMSMETKNIVLNKDVIAIDQDPLGKQAFRVWRKDGVEAWKKPMAGGKVAIAFLNRNSTSQSVTVPYDQLELEPQSAYISYDVWKHEQVKQPAGALQSKLTPHETQVFVLAPAN